MSIARLPTPIYNTPVIPHLKSPLQKDHQGLLKTIEHIALPGTKFTVIREVSQNICEVTTSDYPSSTPLYVDSRFLTRATPDAPERKKSLPSPEAILLFLKSVVGIRYFWGGNWAKGIPEMTQLYPPPSTTADQDDALCVGLDCSGLLYQATDGFTPRNTTDLVHYGQALNVDLDSPAQVQKAVKPLDMMVCEGHVIFVLDPDHFIESVLGKGVIITDFIERYTHFHDKLRAENKSFSVRRWHPHFLT